MWEAPDVSNCEVTGPWFNIKMPSYQYRKFHWRYDSHKIFLHTQLEFSLIVRWHLYTESIPVGYRAVSGVWHRAFGYLVLVLVSLAILYVYIYIWDNPNCIYIGDNPNCNKFGQFTIYCGFTSKVRFPLFTCYCQHDDVIKWKHFPHYWPFVWGIHW